MSSQNIGEEIAGLYLQLEHKCAFVQYNLYTPDVQGEIDVIAINFTDKIVYICEVAVHLVTGLRYVKDGKSDNYERVVKKFNKDIDYAQKAFPDYKRVYMLWSPIVKAPNQLAAVQKVYEELQSTRDIEIQLIINEKYQLCLDKLRDDAARQTKELKSPVLRLFQIEALLDQHLEKSMSKTKFHLSPDLTDCSPV